MIIPLLSGGFRGGAPGHVHPPLKKPKKIFFNVIFAKIATIVRKYAALNIIAC